MTTPGISLEARFQAVALLSADALPETLNGFAADVARSHSRVRLSEVQLREQCRRAVLIRWERTRRAQGAKPRASPSSARPGLSERAQVVSKRL